MPQEEWLLVAGCVVNSRYPVTVVAGRSITIVFGPATAATASIGRKLLCAIARARRRYGRDALSLSLSRSLCVCLHGLCHLLLCRLVDAKVFPRPVERRAVQKRRLRGRRGCFRRPCVRALALGCDALHTHRPTRWRRRCGPPRARGSWGWNSAVYVGRGRRVDARADDIARVLCRSSTQSFARTWFVSPCTPAQHGTNNRCRNVI